MKHNRISRKLTKQIILLILSFSTVILLANSLLLTPFYYYNLKLDMVKGIQALSSVDIDLLINESIPLDNSKINYDIAILDDSNVLYYSSRIFGYKKQVTNDRRPSDLEHTLEKLHMPFEEVTTWETFDNVQIGTLETAYGEEDIFIAKYNDGQYTYVLSQPIEPLRNSVQSTNMMLMIITGVFLVISFVFAHIISKRFTKPILHMQQHVLTLSQLNFDEKLTIKTKDELESLSHDINQLSDELQHALTVMAKQNKQLERDIESQKNFISNASHELRTPLTLIKGYSDEIVHGFTQNKEQEISYVQYISEEASKMTRMLNEILDLSRLESGQMKMMYTHNNIKDVIQNFMDKYIGFIDDHQLKVTLDLIDGVGYFDVVRFEQLLANYVSNAGKYCDDAKELHITMSEHQACYRIHVKNSGEPLSDHIMQFIWDGFYKADEARTSIEGSYGLGLSIVRAIQDICELDYGCYNEEHMVVFWFDVKKNTHN